MFLAAGSGICVFSRRAAVLLQRALLGRQLRDAGVALGPCGPRSLAPTRGRGRVRFGGVGAERAGRLGQAVDLPHAGRLLHAVHGLHEDGAVGQVAGAHLVHAVPPVVGLSVQRDGVVSAPGQAVHEGGGLDEEPLGAVGREPIPHLGEGQGGVRVGAIQVPVEGNRQKVKVRGNWRRGSSKAKQLRVEALHAGVYLLYACKAMDTLGTGRTRWNSTLVSRTGRGEQEH